MNGAEGLMRAAVASGVEVCFTNPGTTEMHMVGALDSVPGIRAVLALFEGVATGAADGYGRMADKPAMTLLHLGPGHANGIANLHNARRARTPILAVIGDHPTWHLANDAPLTSDIDSLAWPVSKFVRRVAKARSLAGDVFEAIAAARALPRGVSTLIVPGECAWDPIGELSAPPSPAEPSPVDEVAVDAAAAALRDGRPAALLLGGSGLRVPGLRAAGRIAQSSGCTLLSETFISRVERGAGIPAVAKIPYFPEQASDLLERFSHLILVGAEEPVAFFGYPGRDGRVVPESCAPLSLATPQHDAAGALEALAERLAAAAEPSGPPLSRPEVPVGPGPLDPAVLGAVLAAVQPEGAIVMDEAATSGLPYWAASAGCPPHDYLGLTGGAIGQGLPCATGAAVACPDRPVIAVQADGSGMYTVQSLWTQAREGLDVTTLICSNREYRILRVELARADISSPGPQAQSVTSLADPALDWVALARGMGVPGAAVETAEALARELRRAFAEPGPHLIEARI